MDLVWVGALQEGSLQCFVVSGNYSKKNVCLFFISTISSVRLHYEQIHTWRTIQMGRLNCM